MQPFGKKKNKTKQRRRRRAGAIKIGQIDFTSRETYPAATLNNLSFNFNDSLLLCLICCFILFWWSIYETRLRTLLKRNKSACEKNNEPIYIGGASLWPTLLLQN